jgi:hypothetical protein
MLLTINKFVESDAPTSVRIQGIKQLIGPLPADKEYLTEKKRSKSQMSSFITDSDVIY